MKCEKWITIQVISIFIQKKKYKKNFFFESQSKDSYFIANKLMMMIFFQYPFLSSSQSEKSELDIFFSVMS